MPKSPLKGRWTCGHKRTKKNSTNTRWPQCLMCKRKKAREWARAHSKAPAKPMKPDRPRIVPPSIGPRPYAVLMAEAKAEYQALLEREKDARKGGRPNASGRGGQKPMGHVGQGRPNQFVNVHEDPRDALLNALGTFQGAA